MLAHVLLLYSFVLAFAFAFILAFAIAIAHKEKPQRSMVCTTTIALEVRHKNVSQLARRFFFLNVLYGLSGLLFSIYNTVNNFRTYPVINSKTRRRKRMK